MSETIRTSYEVFLVGDPDGYYEVGITEEDAFQRYQDNIGDVSPGMRLIALLTHVSFPARQVTEIEVPAEAGTIVTAELAQQYSAGEEP